MRSYLENDWQTVALLALPPYCPPLGVHVRLRSPAPAVLFCLPSSGSSALPECSRVWVVPRFLSCVLGSGPLSVWCSGGCHPRGVWVPPCRSPRFSRGCVVFCCVPWADGVNIASIVQYILNEVLSGFFKSS